MQLLFGENIPTCLLALGIKIFTFRGKSVIISKISLLVFYKDENKLIFVILKAYDVLTQEKTR